MKIIRAFRHRHPACAALIGLLFGPAIVMAYLGRGWLAVVYFVIELAVGGVEILLFGAQHSFAVESFAGSLALRIVGMAHGYLAARSVHGDRQFPWYARWWGLILIFVVAAYAFGITVRSFLFQPFNIPAGSMMPTLQVGDYVFASKYAYGYGRYSLPYGLGPRTRLFGSAPERGDVVIFRLPTDTDIDYVKRVIGLPGDRVQMIAGVLHLNGAPLALAPEGSFEIDGESMPMLRETLPSGRSYPVLDTMSGSRGDDTIEFTVPEGHNFMIGDNRDNSLDSRFSVGFVPDANIIGKVVLIVTNTQRQEIRWVWLD